MLVVIQYKNFLFLMGKNLNYKNIQMLTIYVYIIYSGKDN